MKEDGSLHHSLQESNLVLQNANPEPEALQTKQKLSEDHVVWL